jgi:hypothetical protein
MTARVDRWSLAAFQARRAYCLGAAGRFGAAVTWLAESVVRPQQ